MREHPAFPANLKTLGRIVELAFQQRRKMLRGSLKGQAPDIEDRLIAAGIKPTDRAEQISIEAFCALAREIHKPWMKKPRISIRGFNS